MDWSKKRCVVLDMDGTVYLGNIPIAGTVRFIREHWHDVDFFFLSNNTSQSPQTSLDKLRSMGIPANRESLLSPVTSLINFLRIQAIHRAYPVGNRNFRQTLREAMPELEQTEKDAQAVILAYDTELTYDKLARSALLLQQANVVFLATHPDLVCPSPEGPLPDVGSMIQLYAAATGRFPQHIFGKPNPDVLAPLLTMYSRDEMVIVGDRLSTDKKLAENAGIDFVLVLSGEATREDAQREERQPDQILHDLGEVQQDWQRSASLP